MTTTESGGWVRAVIGQLRPGEALARFPLPLMAAGIVTALALIAANIEAADERVIADVMFAVSSFGLAAFTAVLFAEVRRWPWAGRIGASGLAGLAAALAYWFGPAIGLNLAAFAAALVLALAIVPFLGAPRNDGAYWAFNHDLWVAAAYGLVGQLILGGGVTLLMVTVDYLFQTRTSDLSYGNVWIIAALFVGPAVWLSMAPRPPSIVDLGSPPQADPRAGLALTTVFQGVILIVTYLLIPLVLAYTIILYAYAGKIALAFELPQGKIGWLVSGFAAAGVVTALLAWPVRETGGALVRFFWRYWFALTVVPLVLLAVGTAARIEAYNLTASRYVLVLIGLWIAILAVAFSLGERRRDLRLITGTLFAFALITMAGPLSITGLPGRFLAAEMRQTLADAGMLDAAGHMRAAPAGTASLDETAKARVGSVVQTLAETGELDALKPIAGRDLRQAFAREEARWLDRGRFDGNRSFAFSMARVVADEIGLEPRYLTNQWLGSGQNWFSRFSVRTAGIPVGDHEAEGAALLIGPVNAHTQGEIKLTAAEAGELAVRLEDARLVISGASADYAFDLLAVRDVVGAAPNEWRASTDAEGARRLGLPATDPPRAIAIKSETGGATLHITGITVQVEDGQATLRSAYGWLIVPRPAAGQP